MLKKEIVFSFNRLLSKFKKFKHIKIDTLPEINKIPLTTREELSNFKFSKCVRMPPELYFTSGTTKDSFSIYQSVEAAENTDKRTEKLFRLIGISKEDIVINFMDYGFTPPGMMVHRVMRRIGATIVPVGTIREDNIDAILNFIKEVRPSILIGTHSILYGILTRENQRYKFIKKVISGGSVLTEKFRRSIQQTFCGDLYNLYGCNEIGCLAIQDNSQEKEWLRLIDDNLCVEIMKENGEVNECGRGKIIISDLYNFSFPIVRYMIGDYVEIVKRKEDKYIRIFGREDNHTKINYEVISINQLTKIIMDVLGHNRFNIIVENDPCSLRDSVKVLVSIKDEKYRNEIRNLMKRKAKIDVLVFSFQRELIKNKAGNKYRNFIDTRTEQLEIKNLHK